VAEEKVKADQPSRQDQSERSGLLYTPSGLGQARHRRRPSQVPRAKKLVTFPKDGRVIQQADLEEFFLLQREMDESTSCWEAKRDYILELLKSGARVEGGVHTAEIELTLKVR
jgi:hypothetical protein